MTPRIQSLPMLLVILVGLGGCQPDRIRCMPEGDARFWAMDRCLWEYETDDSIHPGD